MPLFPDLKNTWLPDEDPERVVSESRDLFLVLSLSLPSFLPLSLSSFLFPFFLFSFFLCIAINIVYSLIVFLV